MRVTSGGHRLSPRTMRLPRLREEGWGEGYGGRPTPWTFPVSACHSRTMTKAHLEARLLRPAAALYAALIDPERRESTLVLVLFIYWLVWTAYATISKGGQGLHPDMTELIAWSRDPALGYFKHPPLAAWLVGAWFTAFPVSEPAYYLLAMLMPVLALWIAWRLMDDYLDADKRVFGLALLTLVPFFNFHALKYNVNTVLLPLW